MSNTGFKKYTLLIQVDGDGNPTGLTKPNSPLDPDYVSPVYDTVACPLPGTTTTTTTEAPTTTTTTTVPGTHTLTGTNNISVDNIEVRLLRQSDDEEIAQVTVDGSETITSSIPFSTETNLRVHVYAPLSGDGITATVEVYEGVLLVHTEDYTDEHDIFVNDITPNTDITVVISVITPIVTTTTTILE